MTDPNPAMPTGKARGANPRVHRFEHEAMGCTFGLHLIADDGRYAQQAARAAFDEVDRLEQILSRFVPHSDVARLNALAPGEPIRVSIETIECLQLAARIYTETNGAFDIAFRSAYRNPATSPATGPPPLVLDPANHTVGVQVTGVTLDLGALGKGYAVDRMLTVLGDWGIAAGLVHSGQSTVYALGCPPAESGWCVALRQRGRENEHLGRVTLADCALSGSGQRLHGRHIIDPRTGRPAEGAHAAWAIAPNGALSDALATAFMVLSPREVEELCGRYDDVSAILVPAAGATQEPLCFGAQSVCVKWADGHA